MTDPYDPDKLRASLRRVMSERKLYSELWCERAGLSASTINNFLRGYTHAPTISSLYRLAAAAGTTIADLLEIQTETKIVQSRLRRRSFAASGRRSARLLAYHPEP